MTLADIAARARRAGRGAGRARSRTPERSAGDADLVFHASGQPDGLRTALAVAGLEARIVELSWYGSAEVALPLGEAFHSRRLTLQSSQVGQVAAADAAALAACAAAGQGAGAAARPVLDRLITGEIAFADLPTALPRLAAHPDGALCLRIVYPSLKPANRELTACTALASATT